MQTTKSLFSLSPILLTGLAFSHAFAAPTAPISSPSTAMASSMPPLPPEVAATMTPDARSLHSQVFLMGGHHILVNLWAPMSGNTNDPKTAKAKDSSVHLDLFVLGASPKHWVLANTAVLPQNDNVRLTGDAKTEHITMRWLQPAKKKGLVVVVTSGSAGTGPIELIAFPKGVASTPVHGSVSDFFVGDTGPSFVTQKFGVDKKGYLMVEQTATEPPRFNNDSQGRETKTLYKWNGFKFAYAGG